MTYRLADTRVILYMVDNLRSHATAYLKSQDYTHSTGKKVTTKFKSITKS